MITKTKRRGPGLLGDEFSLSVILVSSLDDIRSIIVSNLDSNCCIFYMVLLSAFISRNLSLSSKMCSLFCPSLVV